MRGDIIIIGKHSSRQSGNKSEDKPNILSGKLQRQQAQEKRTPPVRLAWPFYRSILKSLSMNRGEAFIWVFNIFLWFLS